MSEDPQQVAAALPEELRLKARGLAYGPQAYFLEPKGTRVVPLDRLRLSRARPDGIASAITRMLEAAAGTRPRRAPVNVRWRADGMFEVLDGNSTVVSAAAAGWPDLPCIVDSKATPEVDA